MNSNKFVLNNIFKASLVGLLVVIVNLIPLEKILGITLGDLGVMPTIYFIPMFFVYSLIALVFSKMKNNLNLEKKGAFVVIFSFLFVINVLLTSVEGNFYLSNFPFTFTLIYGFILALLITLSIFYLWKQDDNPVNVKEQIRLYFSSRSIFSWIWKSIVVLFLFYVFIMILGAITFPLTGHYLENGLFKMPTMLEFFTITMLRSVFYLLVTLPFIIFWKSSKKSLFLYLSLINILIYPVLGDGFAYFWPAMYRLIDGIVLATHAILMSWLYITILKKDTRKLQLGK